MTQLDLLIQYLQLYKEKVVYDNQKDLILEFRDLDEITKKLPLELIELDFFDYIITYYVESFDSLVEFQEEIQVSYQGRVDCDEGKIRVSINKNLLKNYFNQDLPVNTEVFYNLKNFVANIKSVQDSTNESINKKIIFVIEKLSESFYENEYLFIVNLMELSNQNPKPILPESIERFKTMQEIYDYKDINHYQHIPSFWHFSNQDDDLKPLKKECIKTFFYLIANKTKGESEIYIIKGHHNLEFKLRINSYQFDTSPFLRILNFTLDKEKHYDKLLIIRNVFTTYVNNFSLFSQVSQQINEIVATIEHHYELYIQNEMKIFIEQKNQVLNETLSLAKQVSNLTIEIGSNIRNLLLTLFAAIVVSVIPQYTENSNNENIILLLTFSYLVYLIFNFYISFKIKNQLDNYLENFKNYTGYISSQSLAGLDYQSLKNNFIYKEEVSFYDILMIYRLVIYALIILSICLILYLFE